MVYRPIKRKPLIIKRVSSKKRFSSSGSRFRATVLKVRNAFIGASVLGATAFGAIRTVGHFSKPTKPPIKSQGTIINLDEHYSPESVQRRAQEVALSEQKRLREIGERKRREEAIKKNSKTKWKPEYAMRDKTPGLVVTKKTIVAEPEKRVVVSRRTPVAIRTVRRESSVLFPRNPISASFIEFELARMKSPARGFGSKFVEYGRKHNIDPAVALAFFRIESSCGTKGIAVQNKSVGNIRYTKLDDSRKSKTYSNNNGFRKYSSWDAGIEDFFKHLTQSKYYIRAGRTTVEKIVPVYAPSIENDTANYIRRVNAFVSEYHANNTIVASRK